MLEARNARRAAARRARWKSGPLTSRVLEDRLDDDVGAGQRLEVGRPRDALDQRAAVLVGRACRRAPRGRTDCSSAARERVQRRLVGLVDHDRDPARATDSAMPEPMNPPPTTPAFSISLGPTVARAYPWGGAFDPRAAGHPRARRMRGIVVGADHHGGRSAARHGHHAAGAAGPGRGRPRRAPAVDRAVLVTDLRHRATGRHQPPVRAPARRQRDRAARRPAGGHVPAREHDDRRRARPALDGLRARLRAVRPLLRLLHRPGRRRSTSTSTAPIRPRPGRPRIAAARALDPAPRDQPQRRAARSSAPTACSTSASATAAARATTRRGNGQDLGVLLGKILRIDPRAGGRPAVHGPRRQPVRRRAGRAARDLRLRPAQPVALLLRPLDRRPGDRRRRPGHGRGGRLRRPRARPRAPTSAGASFEGRSPYNPGERAAARCRRCSAAPTPPAGARSSAATSCATRRCRRCAAATSTATCARPHCTRRACARTRPRTGRSACGCRSSSRSGRMPPAMFTPSSLTGPVYRIDAG